MFADRGGRQHFWHRHPWVCAAALLTLVWLVHHGAYVTAAVMGLTVVVIAVRRTRRHRRHRDAGLRARADLEHRMALAGDPRGVHGRYPPIHLDQPPGRFQTFGQ